MEGERERRYEDEDWLHSTMHLVTAAKGMPKLGGSWNLSSAVIEAGGVAFALEQGTTL